MSLSHVIFPLREESSKTSTLLLVARVIFALLLASHGYQKLMAFNEMATQFPDPIGLGSETSLALAIFGELACSIAVIAGFLTRLALIPTAFTMGVAFFITHGGSIAQGELAFVYFIIFVLLIFAGPGRYSIDGLIANKIKQ